MAVDVLDMGDHLLIIDEDGMEYRMGDAKPHTLWKWVGPFEEDYYADYFGESPVLKAYKTMVQTQSMARSAAAKIAEAAREKAAREAKVRNSDGYRAAIEGRD